MTDQAVVSLCSSAFTAVWERAVPHEEYRPTWQELPATLDVFVIQRPAGPRGPGQATERDPQGTGAHRA
ncbi:hypothetical protein [Streptomyces sp. enrichment culture]|uniref:hypothetical protein n=1 Tax=Streptomyces sp. enrichment culture TaxID=1795815 RepID=UPI003F5555D5